MSRRLSRRELAALIGAGVVTRRVAGTSPREGSRPGVVSVTRASRPVSGGIDRSAARRAVDAVLAGAVGCPSGTEAAARLFAPADTVGVKVNCLGGPRLSPRVELVDALAEILAEAGVPRSRIIVFERSSRELQRAGFPLRRAGGPYLCYGIDNDYDRSPTISGAIGSCFARLVSTTCTALVSFGVVKDHDLAGVSAGLKNWYGVIHNPNKYHDNNCDPYVADVVRHVLVRDKLRLTVLDGTVAQCHGGPAFRAGGIFALGKVAASTDPVAADTWAWKEIDAERERRGLPSLEQAGRPPRFIGTAARHGLGVGDREAIREVTS